MLRLEQFNGFTAHINSTILMLNDVWNSLVYDVKATKKCYDELEAAMMMTNDISMMGFPLLTPGWTSVRTNTVLSAM